MQLAIRLLGWLQGPSQKRWNISRLDAATYFFIALLGAWQFTHFLHTSDFVTDTTYTDLAQSLFQKGLYELDFHTETMYPPGFPVILALVGWLAGFTPAVMLRTIAVSTIVGLISAYELLRRAECRCLGVITCSLLGASPFIFGFVTQEILSDMPFFGVSMLALLLALQLDRSPDQKSRLRRTPLLAVALVLAVLIRSSGIALLAGLCTWVAVSLAVFGEHGRRRLKWFLIPIILGISAQLMWTEWARHRQSPPEWQLGGWPQSYMEQLKVKNGNYPELGAAHLGDITARIGDNLVSRAAEFGWLLTGEWVSWFWSSPAVICTFVLIVLGLGYSILKTGGQLHDWYFLWYEVMYLLWPWTTEPRFLIPVLPLGCLYLWRGAKVVKSASLRHSRAAGICLAVAGSLLGIAATLHAIAVFHAIGFKLKMDCLQPPAAALFWAMLALVGAGMIGLLPSHRRLIAGFQNHHAQLGLAIAIILTITAIAGRGIKEQISIGEDNVHFDATKAEYYPDIEGAEWIRTHEAPNSVVMARDKYIVFHYSHDPVVWFPPISNPKILSAGIRKHNVKFIVVVHRGDSYWLPPEEACFQQLLPLANEEFRLVHRGPGESVYEVESPKLEPPHYLQIRHAIPKSGTRAHPAHKKRFSASRHTT